MADIETIRIKDLEEVSVNDLDKMWIPVDSADPDSTNKVKLSALAAYIGGESDGKYIPLAGSSEIIGNLIPKNNKVISLGSIEKLWKALYGDEVYASSVLTIPQAAPSSPASGLFYLYVNPTGNYAQEPGGSVGAVYPLHLTINGTTHDYDPSDEETYISLGTYLTSVPMASAQTLGGIKVGSGLSIDSNGVLTATYSYTLPKATTTTLGGVIVGSGISVDGNGVISVSFAGYATSSYVDAQDALLAEGIVNNAGRIHSLEDWVRDWNIDNYVAQWAQQATKPTYSLDEVADGSTRKLANYIPLAGSSAITGSLIPSANKSISLGSSSKLWKALYGDEVYASSVLTIPQAAPSSPASGLFYLYVNPTGNYAQEPGGSVGAVYPLHLTINGTTHDYDPSDEETYISLGTYLTSVPMASAQTLGGIKVGSGLSIDSNGVLTATYSYTLPKATTSTLGGVIVGSGISVDGNGVISVSFAGYATSSYVDAQDALLAEGIVNNAGRIHSLEDWVRDWNIDNYVAQWAQQATKPTYSLDEVADGSTRKLANYIPLAGSSAITGSLIPSANKSISLGSSSKLWKALYGDEVYASSVLTIPQAAPSSPASGLFYLYVNPTGNYAQEPGGSVGAVYPLHLTINGTTHDYDPSDEETYISLGTYLTSVPMASAQTLGGIKVGSGLSIDSNGVLSATYSYTLPTASAQTLGGIKVGSGLSIDGSGVLSATYSYTLPTASAQVLGGIKVGSGLSIDANGVLTATYSYTLPKATTTTLGGVIVGSGISVDSNGVISVSFSGYATSSYVDAQDSMLAEGVASNSARLQSIEDWLRGEKEYDWNDIYNRPTTLAGYRISDAYIYNGTVYLGGSNITPLISSHIKNLTLQVAGSTVDSYSPLTQKTINITTAQLVAALNSSDMVSALAEGEVSNSARIQSLEDMMREPSFMALEAENLYADDLEIGDALCIPTHAPRNPKAGRFYLYVNPTGNYAQ